MPAQFHAVRETTRELCSELAELDPCNPFHTFEYKEAMRAPSTQPWLFCLRENGRILAGCLAFLRKGRLNRSLEIPSVPCLPSGDHFWAGLVNFCRQARVSDLSVGSFASASAVIPALPGEKSRRMRVEYSVVLGDSTPWSGMSSNHQRNLRKAQKAGLLIERTTKVEACQVHALLQDASMERRMIRGEQVLADSQVRTFVTLVEHQAGELFRATRNGEVLSSILVLRAQRGAYYHSAGTSREGMAVGASHFLIHQVTELLRAEGMERFNLGGADASNPGLERFKSGFGVQEIQLQSAEFDLASPLRRKATAGLKALRDNPIGLLRDLAGHVDKYFVYCCDPKEIEGGRAPAGVKFRKITDRELLQAAQEHPEMQRYQELYEKCGTNAAYGVFVDGTLAHVSWLILPELDRRGKERNVKLTAGEAEITHAVTLLQFQNCGLYAYAIRCLADVCRGFNIKRLFMITGDSNVASQKGIQKAGLHSAGRIWRVKYRHLGGWSFAVRGHRFSGPGSFFKVLFFRNRA